MGSRSEINFALFPKGRSAINEVDCAYIAGFLDGDGSLMLQIKKRKDLKNRSWRFMCTICFYQDKRHSQPLEWFKEIFGIGYISHRKDGMTELRINGFKQVHSILKLLIPYIKFKREQALAIAEACEILEGKRAKDLSENELRRLVFLVHKVQENNYVTKAKKTEEHLLLILGLTP